MRVGSFDRIQDEIGFVYDYQESSGEFTECQERLFPILDLMLSEMPLTSQEQWSTQSLTTQSIITEIDSCLENLQKQGIKLKDPEKIRDYLLRFPDIIEIIPRVIAVVRKCLPDAWLFLEVYKDPEIDDQYLILYARFREYDETTLKRIEEAEAGYLDWFTDKEGWLQLSTDFQELEAEDAL